MKLKIFIRDSEYFLRGEYFVGVSVCGEGEGYMSDDCQIIAEVEIDLDAIDRGEITKHAIEKLDKEEQEFRARTQEALNSIEARKGKLLALPSGESK